VTLNDLERRNSPYFALFHRIQISKLLFFIFKQPENGFRAQVLEQKFLNALKSLRGSAAMLLILKQFSTLNV